MARYTGPKARVNRRFGAMLYENAGCVRAYEKRSENPPGMHPRSRRSSNYGTALSEKQKIKYYYGLGERQLRRYFDDAVRKKGNTGETLLLLCNAGSITSSAESAWQRPVHKLAKGLFTVTSRSTA